MENEKLRIDKELKPYNDYKKAKQEWLNIIPTHWKQAKSKRLFNETSIKNCENEELLSATQNRGVIPRSMLITRVVMPSGNLNTFKLVQEGNFVISLRSFQGGLEYSKYRGVVSPAYNILEQKSKQNPMYYKHLFKSHDFIGELQRNVTGIRQGKNIDVNDFKEIILPLPPLDEQDKIVKYLDFQLAKINKFILAKKKLILALKEQKQVVINEAVTKGLNPNLKMKPSGIEWIGDIPEHWSVIRNKSVMKLRKDIVGDNSNKYTLLSLTTKGIIARDIESGKGKFPTDFNTYQVVNTNNLIFCLFDIDETPRTVGLSDLNGMVTGAYTVFSIDDACREYVYYYYLALDQKKGLKPLYTGLRKTIQKEVFLRSKLPYPPESEQLEIVNYIKRQSKQIDSAIDIIQQEIDLISEYRTRLISEVVTGKVDVRHIKIDDIVEEETEIYETEDEGLEIDETLDSDEE